MTGTIKYLTPVMLLAGQLLIAEPLPVQSSTRERISINDNWRFTKGDLNGDSTGLIYDVRPEVKDKKDDKAADSEPTEAEKIAATNRVVLKPWILPTANAFIKDPARHHARPMASAATNVSYAQFDFDDSSWQIVSLPHDWAIEGPFNKGANGVGGGMGRLPSPGIGWYRKQLYIPAGDAGKSIFLDVDGAMSYAIVWLNGQLVGGWPYGYASWRLDLTPYIMPGGTNQLAIRLDNPRDSARWYPGGGIYRNVWLTKTQPVHIGQWGTYLTTTNVSVTNATVHLSVTTDNDSKQLANVDIETEIFALDANGRQTGDVVAKIAPASMQIAAGGSSVTPGSVTIANPKLWGPPPTQKPNRYVAVTTVSQNQRVIDRYETPFGIRDMRFDPDKGIIVNGEHIPLRGVNQHHDLGALGAAFNIRAAQRQLELLREMGCNAVRMSHNPPAPELLELCDQMGFLVIDEIFDCWERKKTPLDFYLIFADWHEPDLRALIRRDRNHPSVFLWSVGNEVGEQYTGEEGAKVAKQLCDIAHEEDSTRPTITGMNYARPDMPLPATVDVIGLNYQGEGIRQDPEFEGTERIRTAPQYSAFHEKFPGKVILSTETASAFSSRGVYLFPVSPQVSAPVRDGRGGDSHIHQVSAYELHAVDFGSTADKVFASLDQHPFVAGEFVWNGWDYLGEPTPYYEARSSYSGIIDLAGFKKDRFYLYQAHWRPDFPMAHILPHWIWPGRAGQVTPVHVFTSGDEAELFLNGKSLGRKKKGAYEYRLRWDEVVYEPGTLKVVAYKNGKPWAMDEVKTTGDPAGLSLTSDRNAISADGKDLAFVTVKVVDKDGLIAPRADNRIHFEIEGPGEILATDNGDPTSFEPFQAQDRRVFNGLGLAIVRARPGMAGKIRVTASSDGLKTGSTTIDIASLQNAESEVRSDGSGAYVTGSYRNLFSENGHSQKEVRQKIDSAFQQLFHGDLANQTIYYNAGSNSNGPLAYITDIRHNDVRTEGLSYGMIIAVQLDKQAEFDALWNWSKTFLYVTETNHPSFGFFAWQARTNGVRMSQFVAPDGEEYYVTALYFAAHRWGNGKGIYNYKAEADELLSRMRHRGLISGNVLWRNTNHTVTAGPLFDAGHQMVLFSPSTERNRFSDPSYHLPAFYELWSRWGPPVDAEFWSKAAEVSRDYFVKVNHPVTGLNPCYANFDGSLVEGSGSYGTNFSYDAFRTAGNWSVDWSWWAKDPRQHELSDKLQAFFESQGTNYGCVFTLEGRRLEGRHAQGLAAMNAVASLAATNPRSRKFVEELWDVRVPDGMERYYEGLLYLMGLLHCSGEFRIWNQTEDSKN